MIRRQPLFLALALLAAPFFAAADSDRDSTSSTFPEQLVEDFGRVLYCQQAYEAPQNQRRVYGHDLEQCASARKVIDQALAVYPLEAQAQLQGHAKRRAAVIRSNTQDVYQVLGACREACEKIAGKEPADMRQEPRQETKDKNHE